MLCGALMALLARSALATPYDYLEVGDPLESELRILDLVDEQQLQGRIRLPHLATRPLQLIEIEGSGPPIADPCPVCAVSITRLERALGRDRAPDFAPHPTLRSTPRLLDYGDPAQRLEVSVGVEGRGELYSDDRRRLVSGSGIQGRISLGLDRLHAYSHYTIGHYDNARTFADPIVAGQDVIVLTDETYLSYTEQHAIWGARFGRARWHWGPGEEGSLVLSKTAVPVTGLAFRAHLEALRADAIALSATLADAAGEQLAAHRIEWQPFDGLRVGVTEAARYKAPGWRPLYLIGAIPYVLVQRLEVQSEPDSASALRNNVLTAFDAGWRISNGTRVYGEFLIDDLHTRSGKDPNKFAYQVGWEGVGMVSGRRISWGGEYTRVTRYVYTSFFGRAHVSEGIPLGFPVAPDSRRVRLRMLVDPNADWQFGVWVTNTDKGQNTLDEPFVPGSGQVSAASEFEGVIETTRDLDLRARWWPASGVIISVWGGYTWVEDADHVIGAKRRSARGALELRLMR